MISSLETGNLLPSGKNIKYSYDCKYLSSFMLLVTSHNLPIVVFYLYKIKIEY